SSVPMEGVEEKEAEPREQPSASTEEETAHEEEDVAGSVSVFVKGLNFDTTEEVECFWKGRRPLVAFAVRLFVSTS
ncbi:hypothetical protein FOZ62_022050, partial [Perkinsus olseni]